MEEISFIHNNLNTSSKEQIQTASSSPNINGETASRSKKSLLKKILLIFLLFISFVLIMVFNRFIYPVVTFLPQPLKPWSRTEGKVCSFGGCRTSEVNQIYYYWLSEAINNKNPNLCNNTVGLEGGDIGISSKEYSISLCKIEYSKKTGDTKVCDSLQVESKIQCLLKVAEAFSKPELLDINICTDLKDSSKIGNCLASISLKTKTYTCNQFNSRDIKKTCDSELLMFHEKSIHEFKGIEVIKKTGTIMVPVGGNIWGVSTNVTNINNDGSIGLWLNGTRYSCQPNQDVFLRSSGPVCTPEIPIYYITRCFLEGNNVTLSYFVYDSDCHW